MVVHPGEVHGLVGENGSGKSTLVKVLSGYHRPDPGGSLAIDGEPVALPVRPALVRKLGLSVVHQDLGLIDGFSVLENMRVGLFGVNRLTRAIRWRTERELARATLAALGAELDLGAPVGELSAAQRATVAIARAMQQQEPGQGVIMFDESTRALPPEPRRHFHELVRELVGRGGSALVVSHQLDEVLAHTDRVTVLRDGQVVASGVPTAGLSERELIRLMLGRELSYESRARSGQASSGPALAEIRALRGSVVADVSLSLRAGEVLGVTGLLGSGFEELPYLVAGARPARHGALVLAGREFDLARASVRELLSAGVALVPERREVEGLALTETVRDNVTLPRVRGAHLSRPWQQRETEWVLRELGVRPAEPRMVVGQLSGGNQQKVLLGKWLCGRPRLLVLHEPTQGVDVGARRELERTIARAADEGAAVLLAGMDASELASMCDRVLVLKEGRVHRELSEELSPGVIVDAVYGERRRAVAA